MLLLDTCYKTVLETRADWLGLEAIMIINYLRTQEESQRDIAGYPALIKKIRETFIEATEGLADQAIRRGELTIGDFADVILEFYKALPKGLFDHCNLVNSMTSLKNGDQS